MLEPEVFKLVNGDLIIGEVTGSTEQYFNVSKTGMFAMTEEGMMIVPHAPYAEPENEITLNKSMIVHGPEKAKKAFADLWRQVTSPIIQPKASKIII